MIQLLIIADDFTGALDTGVPFASKGIKTKVTINKPEASPEAIFTNLSPDIQILVIDAETRHLTRDKAYQTVYQIVAVAKEKKVPFIYKKIDSALRGNIGAETEALLLASGEAFLPFIPAYPKMNRITQNGIHYINGVPVAKSVFGKDPFEPVRYSAVKDIIKVQSNLETIEIPISDKDEDKKEEYNPVSKVSIKNKNKAIWIFDAETNQQLEKIGHWMKETKACHIMAGCAGFAEILPKILSLSGCKQKERTLCKKIFVICGSVNPITKKQLNYGEMVCGYKRIYLTSEQKFRKDYWKTDESNIFLEQIKKYWKENICCILDSNDKKEDNSTLIYAQKHDYSLDDMRKKISCTLGTALKKLLEMGVKATFLITGGDTLLGFMEQIGIYELFPICEIADGCVLADFEYQGENYYVISKSGGFGKEALLEEIQTYIKTNTNKECAK